MKKSKSIDYLVDKSCHTIAMMFEVEKIDVVFAIDHKYIQHFCVAATSLLKYNYDRIGRIFLINNVEDQDSLKKIFSFFWRKYKKKIISLNPSNSALNNFEISGHYTIATYYRLFLSDILPDSINKVLFLDSDIVVNGKLDDLIDLKFQIDINNDGKFDGENKEFFLYAVDEISWQEKNRLLTLGLDGSAYFNGGVLLINLKKWREENITEKLVAVALKFDQKLLYVDQDVLNIVFQDHWGQIHSKFNAINLEFCEKLSRPQDYYIIHYTSSSKPWQFKNFHPFKKLYWNFLWRTPYKFFTPKDLTLKNIFDLNDKPFIRKLFRKFLIRIS